MARLTPTPWFYDRSTLLNGGVKTYSLTHPLTPALWDRHTGIVRSTGSRIPHRYAEKLRIYLSTYLRIYNCVVGNHRLKEVVLFDNLERDLSTEPVLFPHSYPGKNNPGLSRMRCRVLFSSPATKTYFTSHIFSFLFFLDFKVFPFVGFRPIVERIFKS